MYMLGRGGRQRTVNIWPGFVDALATLLLVIIFVLMVFIIAQYFLSTALSGRDEALGRLQQQIAELADLLALERSANQELRVNVTQLSTELQSSLEQKESLSSQLALLSAERDDLNRRLAERSEESELLIDRLARLEAERDSLNSNLEAAERAAAELESNLQAARSESADLTKELESSKAITARLARELEDAFKVIDADKEKIEAQLAELAVLKALRDELQAKLDQAVADREGLAEELKQAYESIEADQETIQAQLSELAILRDLRDQLRAEVAALDERLLRAAEALEESRSETEAQEARAADLATRLAGTRDELSEQRQISSEATAQVALLNRQLAALRRQLARISEALDIAQSLNREQEVQIADLGRRLNAALATKVQELARYRSEFFGRLREVLGEREDVRIVGDRFVFQSEVLFESGEAELEPDGRRQMAQLADTLTQIAKEIPSEVDWVLQVNGHTDRRPINTPRFASNWELSTARAISVVKFLIGQGIPADRLSAAGFAHYQPLDRGNDEFAWRRNRRIELKLTSR
jgi:chemotaxis protein MotB